jgi:flagellar hook-basal body complex protein FliE
MAIDNVPGVRADINEILSRIREVSTKSASVAENHSVAPANKFDDVMSILKNSVNHVNEMQNDSDSLKNDFIMGNNQVSMSQVIVSSEKSKLAFEGLVAVRNKILESYKEIMNMPV